MRYGVFSGWGWVVVNLWYITAVLHPISYHTGPRFGGAWLYINTQLYCLTTIYGRVSGNALYSDIIISAIASQITSLTIVYSTVYSGTDHRQHLLSASLAFVRGIHQWPVNSPQKGPVTQKMFPFDGVIMSTQKNPKISYFMNAQCLAPYWYFVMSANESHHNFIRLRDTSNINFIRLRDTSNINLISLDIIFWCVLSILILIIKYNAVPLIQRSIFAQIPTIRLPWPAPVGEI